MHRSHGQHFIRNTVWGAGEQLTITAHHHEGAPLTVALIHWQGLKEPKGRVRFIFINLKKKFWSYKYKK